MTAEDLGRKHHMLLIRSPYMDFLTGMSPKIVEAQLGISSQQHSRPFLLCCTQKLDWAVHMESVAEYAMSVAVNHAFANRLERLDRRAYEATDTPCKCNEWCSSNINTSAVVGNVTCIRDYAGIVSSADAHAAERPGACKYPGKMARLWRQMPGLVK